MKKTAAALLIMIMPVLTILANTAYTQNKKTDVHTESLLLAAQYKPEYDIINELIKQGADINAKDGRGVCPLVYAVANKADAKTIRLLLKNGAKVNGYVLNTAARSRKTPEVLELLINKNPEAVNQIDRNGDTALHIALKYNPVYDNIKLLLDKGADINIKEQQGFNALLTAATWTNNLDIIKLLVERGADIHQYLPNGSNNALTISITANKPEFVKYFIEKGADVNEKTPNGLYPAGMACMNGNAEIIKMLADNGAELSLKDGRGNTAYDYLYRNKYKGDNQKAATERILK